VTRIVITSHVYYTAKRGKKQAIFALQSRLGYAMIFLKMSKGDGAMKKLLAVLLCLIFVGLCACGKTPSAEPEETTMETTTRKYREHTTTPREEPEPEKAFGPSYAVSDTHFYAVGSGLLYVPLEDLSQVRRVPLPIHYEGKWLRDLRIYSVDDKWITLTARTVKEYYQADTEIVYVQLRVALDRFPYEFLGASDTMPDTVLALQAD
jgi:hypothetical protein